MDVLTRGEPESLPTVFAPALKKGVYVWVKDNGVFWIACGALTLDVRLETKLSFPKMVWSLEKTLK